MLYLYSLCETNPTLPERRLATSQLALDFVLIRFKFDHLKVCKTRSYFRAVKNKILPLTYRNQKSQGHDVIASTQNSHFHGRSALQLYFPFQPSYTHIKNLYPQVLLLCLPRLGKMSTSFHLTHFFFFFGSERAAGRIFQYNSCTTHWG